MDANVSELSREGEHFPTRELPACAWDLINWRQGPPEEFLLRSRFARAIVAQRRWARGLRGLVSARIRLLPHQIRIIRRVLSDPICRYLLADEVGLGKTIEAGIVVRQHLLDCPGRRVLVLVPPALEGQWNEELEQKFEAFSLNGSCEICNFADFLDAGRQDRYSLVVIDEAHQIVAGAFGGTPQARGSRNAVSLCTVSESLLLLTATPLTNNEQHYLAMLHLLDPGKYRLEDLEAFRRKIEVRQNIGRLLLALNTGADPFEIGINARSLQQELPHDTIAQDCARELLAEAEKDESDILVLDNLVRRTRTHLSETYRLNRRMVRTRRESLSDSELNPRSQVIQLGTGFSDPDESESTCALIEAWREHTLAIASTDVARQTANAALYRLLWSGYTAGHETLASIIDARIRGIGAAILSEIEAEERAALSALPADSEEIDILEAIKKSSSRSGADRARVAKSPANPEFQYCRCSSEVGRVHDVSECLRIAHWRTPTDTRSGGSGATAPWYGRCALG